MCISAAMFFSHDFASFAAVLSQSPLKAIDIPWAHSVGQPFSFDSDGIITASYDGYIDS